MPATLLPEELFVPELGVLMPEPLAPLMVELVLLVKLVLLVELLVVLLVEESGEPRSTAPV
jgi:hypothetical protein